jgi:hypothetical protein
MCHVPGSTDTASQAAMVLIIRNLYCNFARRYDDIVEKLGPFLKSCGYKKTDLIFLPMSGLMGDNIRDKVDPKRCPWYKVRCLSRPPKALRGDEPILSPPDEDVVSL